MTIASTQTQASYVSNGITTVYPFNNKVFAATDLVVTILDTAGNQYPFTNFTNVALGLSYVVNNVDNDSGCSVQFSAVQPNNYTIDIRTQTAELQSTSIKNQGNFLPELHEEALDKLTREVQDLMRLSYTYGVHGQDIETTAWPPLPLPALRKNTAIIFDNNGNITVGQLPSAPISLISVGTALYSSQTPVEIALSIVPTQPWYPGGDPYVDPRRYGADPTNNPAAVAVTTQAVQNALTVCYYNGLVGGSAILYVGAHCQFRMNNCALTMIGSATQPLRIVGANWIGSALVAAAGLAQPLLTLTTLNPNVGPVQGYIQIQNLSLASAAIVTGGHGLAIYGLSNILLDNVRITNFDHNFELLNVLDITLRECVGLQGTYGCRIGLFGAFTGGGYPTPNLVRIQNCIFGLNTFRGLEYNGGTGFFVEGGDLENNGSGINCTANPGNGAVAATLTANWAFPTGQYLTVFADGEQRPVNYTNGSPNITWAVGLTAAQTAAFINPTGGLFVLGQCSPDLLEGHCVIEKTWFETNTVNICLAAQTNGCQMRYEVKSCELIGAGNGQQLMVGGCNIFEASNMQSASPGDTYNITANFAHLKNISIVALVGSAIGVPIYENVIINGVPQTWGRAENVVLTYTGVSGTVTNTATFYQQGSEVRILFQDVQGTSNATTFTATGVPAKYQPVSTWWCNAVVEDNGADSEQAFIMQSGVGTVTFTKNGGSNFTASGQKGPRRRLCGPYRLDV